MNKLIIPEVIDEVDEVASEMAGDGVYDGREGVGATETGAPDVEVVEELSLDEEMVSDELFIEFL